jgi:hypothetical protein
MAAEREKPAKRNSKDSASPRPRRADPSDDDADPSVEEARGSRDGDASVEEEGDGELVGEVVDRDDLEELEPSIEELDEPSIELRRRSASRDSTWRPTIPSSRAAWSPPTCAW